LTVTQGSSAATKVPSPHFALSILFLVVTVNLFDRQLINILAQNIKLDLDLSDAELGLLTGTAFGLLKALFSIPIASFADRIGRSRILAGLVALRSIFSLLCAATTNFSGLLLGRAGVGLGESAAVPVATALARDYLPQRGTSAIAITMAGNPVGTFLAFLLGGLIAERWGWRWAFLAAGLPGLLLAWALLARLKDLGAKTPPLGASWLRDAAALIRKPLVKPLICATTGSMFMVNTANAWMPAFFMRVHDLGPARAGLYLAIAVGLGGALGTLSGIACDLVRPRIRHPESAIMCGSLLLAVPFMLLMIFSRDTGAALAAYFIYNVLAFAWLGPTIRLIQDAVEPRRRALAIALCGAVGVFVGLGIGVPFIGWVSDLLTPGYGVRGLGIALCLVVAIAIAIALTSHLILMRALLRTEVISLSGF
jgi:predicted MFS family arabinose efflux permease